MHRIDRDTLFYIIQNLIHCSRLKRHRSGRPIIHSLETRQGQEALARLICAAIDNDSSMVIQTEFVTGQQRLGKWGVDEPVPATVPEPPKPPTPGSTGSFRQ